MLPARPKKTSEWKGFVGFGQRFQQSLRQDVDNKIGDLIFDDRLANAKVLSDLDKLNVKRKRTFTGSILISQAGIPNLHSTRNKAFKIGILIFVLFDLFLISYLFDLYR